MGGNTPNHGMNLEDFLQVEGSADLYVLGYNQETLEKIDHFMKKVCFFTHS